MIITSIRRIVKIQANPIRPKNPIPHLVWFGYCSKYLSKLYKASLYDAIDKTTCETKLIKDTLLSVIENLSRILLLPNVS
jgi:hypothetical protein